MAIGNQPTDGVASGGVVAVQPTTRTSTAPPLDPIQQIAASENARLQTATIPVAGIVKIVGEDINRVALFVQSADGSDFFLTPYPSMVFAPPGGAGTARTPQVIHSAVYPVLCQGEWYAAGNPGVVIVFWENTKAG
jgi:hypothetical protein